VTTRGAVDRAAAGLRATLPVFTRGNLLHATVRAVGRPLARGELSAMLAARLRHGPIDGLLGGSAPAGPRLSSFEARAYYPAGILLVDRPSLVDLFAASGALVQSRVAVVATTGEPRPVVEWLVAGARAGRRAPVGWLHDAATVLYPFFFEPLATLFARDPALPFRDLGLRADRGLRDPYTRERVYELEAVTPAALVTRAVRGVLDMLEPDPVLAPRARGAPARRRG
jgi:hypothetical protein